MLMLTTLPTRCGGEITVGLLLSALPVGALFLHYSLYSILSNVVLFFWGGGVRVSPFLDLLNVCSYCCIQIKKFIYFLLTMRTLSWHLLRCSSLKYMGGKKTLIFILPPWNSNDPVWLLWCSTVSILLDLLGQIDGFIFLYITVCCRGNITQGSVEQQLETHMTMERHMTQLTLLPRHRGLSRTHTLSLWYFKGASSVMETFLSWSREAVGAVTLNIKLEAPVQQIRLKPLMIMSVFNTLVSCKS